MPVPLVALALAAGGGLVTGYAIDHLVGDSQYTKEEALLDVGLGVAGGSLVKPAIRVGQRLRTGVRVSAGRPTTFERLAYRAKTERVFASKRDAAMYAMYTTGSRSGGDLKRITKFFGVSGGHSYYLASRGSGAPTGSSSTRTKRPRKGRSRPFSPRSGGAKAPKSARTTYKETRKGRSGRTWSSSMRTCPPGHYWSKRYKKCIRYRKN
jgi:hypothetical protein